MWLIWKLWGFFSDLEQSVYEPRHDKTNKMSVRPAKTQISLGGSESSLCAQWVAKDPSFLHADSEDSDQTGRITWLIWVLAGHTLNLLVLAWCGSYIAFRTTDRQIDVDHNYNSKLPFAICTCNVLKKKSIKKKKKKIPWPNSSRGVGARSESIWAIYT